MGNILGSVSMKNFTKSVLAGLSGSTVQTSENSHNKRFTANNSACSRLIPSSFAPSFSRVSFTSFSSPGTKGALIFSIIASNVEDLFLLVL